MVTLKDTTGKHFMEARADIIKQRFLECYKVLGHITNTCRVLGVHVRTVYHWKRNDPDFLKAFKEAQEEVLDILQDEAFRRAVLGVDKPVFQGGRLVGWTREYSDSLLVLLLKANDPAKYREQWKGELTGADGKPLAHANMQIIHVHSATPMAESEDMIQLTKDDQGNYSLPGTQIPLELIPPSKLPEEEHKTTELSAQEMDDLSDLLDEEEDLAG